MTRPSLARSAFGLTSAGAAVDRWTLDSGTGVRADVLTHGAILHGLTVPAASGDDACVVLNLPTVADYERRSPFFGAVVGRYANRIADGAFTLDGSAYRVPVNDRGHALHGGPDGFDRRLWSAEPGPAGEDTVALRLTLHSADGDMGFPGALDVTATYTLDRQGTLRLDYRATTDAATVVNLTHHAYFNLAGAGIGDVLSHTLALDSAAFLPVGPDGIPLGDLEPTEGTAFDFATPRPIGERIGDEDPQLRSMGGYDHCWALDPAAPREGPLRRAARLADPLTGRRLEVWTTEPGVQVYTGNGLDGSLSGADGKPYDRHGAVCLETQHFPDSPNRPAYPSTVLRPGQAFASTTEFRFPQLAGRPGGT
ncbi:aldose 1-epimerase [Actinacidiphila rubida]|uniref:Aldose 1-epimerase n=1 Tax=Actinacidiphila rubida TaxID=310780 RepID=A0A1H8UY32_9ACTN|nr:aldose epimerase family protein [Actinacidiphila rubida]SEP08132.1 aldose 1-epimerase [Actinacidiphila rubida]